MSYHVDPGEFVILTGEMCRKIDIDQSDIRIIKAQQRKNNNRKKKMLRAKKLSIGYIPQQVASFNAGFLVPF